MRGLVPTATLSAFDEVEFSVQIGRVRRWRWVLPGSWTRSAVPWSPDGADASMTAVPRLRGDQPVADEGPVARLPKGSSRRRNGVMARSQRGCRPDRHRPAGNPGGRDLD